MIHVNQKIDQSDFIPIGIDLRDYYRSVEWDIMSVPAKRFLNSTLSIILSYMLNNILEPLNRIHAARNLILILHSI